MRHHLHLGGVVRVEALYSVLVQYVRYTAFLPNPFSFIFVLYAQNLFYACLFSFVIYVLGSA
jgi:hypothetical protein